MALTCKRRTYGRIGTEASQRGPERDQERGPEARGYGAPSSHVSSQIDLDRTFEPCSGSRHQPETPQKPG